MPLIHWSKSAFAPEERREPDVEGGVATTEDTEVDDRGVCWAMKGVVPLAFFFLWKVASTESSDPWAEEGAEAVTDDVEVEVEVEGEGGSEESGLCEDLGLSEVPITDLLLRLLSGGRGREREERLVEDAEVGMPPRGGDDRGEDVAEEEEESGFLDLSCFFFFGRPGRLGRKDAKLRVEMERALLPLAKFSAILFLSFSGTREPEEEDDVAGSDEKEEWDERGVGASAAPPSTFSFVSDICFPLFFHCPV